MRLRQLLLLVAALPLGVAAPALAGPASSYPNAGTPYSASSTLLGSDANNGNATATFPLGALTNYLDGAISGLTVPQGGTGKTIFSSGYVLLGNGGAGLGQVGGTFNQVFLGQGTGTSSPTFGVLSGDCAMDGATLGKINCTKIGGKSVSLGGAFSTTSPYTLGLVLTGNTSVNLPTSGTLTTQTGSFTTNHCLNWSGAVADSGAASCTVGYINPVKDYGCAGDGVTLDTACLGSAITAAETSGRVLWLGPYKYLTAGGYTDASGALMIQGLGAGWNGNKASQIIASASGTTLFTFNGSGSYIRDTYLKAAASPAGPLIVIGASSVTTTLRDDWIDSPCIGVDMNGNSPTLDHVNIGNVKGAGCENVRIGALTTAAGTTDPRITDSTLQGDNTFANPPDANLLVLDAGGLYLSNDDTLYGANCTEINPGANQQVSWLFASNTVLGDNCTSHALLIQTAATTGKWFGLQFTGSWASSTRAGGSDNILIQPGAGGTEVGAYFSNMRVTGAQGISANGFTLSGGSDISINDTEVCGFNGTGVFIGSGISSVRVQNNTIGLTCGGQSGTTGSFGIAFAGSNSSVVVTGNDVSTMTTPINSTPTGNSVVANNIGVDTTATSVASAATITLASAIPVWTVTGTTGVSTINGYWNGRAVTLITTGGAVAFSTGGNICAAYTSTQNVPVIATYFAASNCWYLK